MSSEPLTPEEIAGLRKRLAVGLHVSDLDVRRLLESHEMLRQENHRARVALEALASRSTLDALTVRNLARAAFARLSGGEGSDGE